MRKMFKVFCCMLVCLACVATQIFTSLTVPVRAADERLENIAYQKPVTASNTVYERGPERVVDGNKDSGSFWDGGSAGNYVTVDLGGYYDISSICVYPYWGDDRYYHYSVFASLDGDQYEEIIRKDNDNISVVEGDTWKIDQKVAHYVRVQIDYNSSPWGSIQLCELEVYGKEHTGSVFDNIAALKEITSEHLDNSAMLTDETLSDYVSVEHADILSLDLADIYKIDEVKLYMKEHAEFAYRLYGSKDGEVYTKLAQGNITDSTAELSLTNINYRGRYIRVQLFNVDSLELSELEVFGQKTTLGDPGENLAIGKTITASATANGQGAANAIDGNVNTYWDGGSIGQYITVDLGDYYRLNEANIVTYFDGERYYKYTISTSTDGTTFTPIAMKYDQTISSSEGTTHDMQQVLARYVRITITYNSSKWGSVHLSELSIYGIAADYDKENLAAQADVSASNSLIDHGPALAADEDFTTYWQGGAQDVITYDLKDLYAIDQITLHPYQDEEVSYIVSAGSTLDQCVPIIQKDGQNTQQETDHTYTFQNNRIRYIQIMIQDAQQQGGKLAEVEVYGKRVVAAEDGDIAFGKPVRTNISQNFASVLTDQKEATVWNARYYPCYADIDLLDTYLVDHIALYMPPSSGYLRFSVYASRDGEHFDKVFTKDDQKPIPADGIMEYELTEPQEARIIRIQFEYNSGSSDVTLSQIRLYGEQSDTAYDLKEDLKLRDYADTEYAGTISDEMVIDQVYGIISRNLGEEYKDWFSFELTHEEGYDAFEISDQNGKIHIKGNKGIALTTGLYHYLKYYPKVQITEVDQQVVMPEEVIPVNEVIRKETPYEVRYAFNYCTLSYSLAFFGEAQWQRELDWLALNGVNVVLDLNGQEAVWMDFLQQAGYSQEEAKDWLTGPGYYAWQFMCNMETFNGPVSDTWIEERLELARKNQYFMRALGMEPVYQAYSGEIPNSIKEKDPEIEIIPQGYWMSFDRPSMLKTTSDSFQKYADMFYEAQERLLGNHTRFYATDPFHEGGQTGGMSRSDVGKYVFDKLKEQHEEAIWIVQSWSLQADTLALLSDQQRQDGVLVLDLEADKFPRYTEVKEGSFTKQEFNETPWVYCFLDNFGGRQGVQAELDLMVDLQNNVLAKTNHMKGIGLSAEGTWANPIQYELLFETAWEKDIDVDEWIQNYIERRYGQVSEAATEAWEIFRSTAYAYPKGGHTGNPESIINATPRFNIAYVAPQGSVNIPYDAEAFNKGVALLLKDYDLLKDSAGYRFDATDMVRQYISNVALDYYRKFTKAYTDKDYFTFDYYAKRFLELIELQDQVLNTDENFLVGTWIQRAKDLGDTYQEDDFQRDLLERNARALITTWGSYDMSSLYFSHDGINYSGGSLQDYANRQYAGLTKDYYLPRWEKWISSLYDTFDLADYEDYTFAEGFELGWNWSLDHNEYATQASGDLPSLAQKVFENYHVAENYMIEVRIQMEDGTLVDTLKQYAASDQNVTFDLPLEDASVVRVEGYDQYDVEGTTLTISNIQSDISMIVIIGTHVNTGALVQLYDQHIDDEKDLYTKTSWDRFHDAMTNAKSLFEQTSVKQEEIDQALSSLQEAIAQRQYRATIENINLLQEAMEQLLALKDQYTQTQFAEASKAILQAQEVLAQAQEEIAQQQVRDTLLAIAQAKGNLQHNDFLDALHVLIDQGTAILASDEIDNVRPGKVSDLRNAIEAAQAMLESGSVEDEQIQEMMRTLYQAIQELYQIVDRGHVEELIQQVAMLTKDRYTADSWSYLETAIALAQALNDDATTEDVQQAYDMVLQAIAALELKTDKKALEVQLSIAKEMLDKKANYIPSTIKDLPEAIALAQRVYDDEQATQAQVKEAYTSLIQTMTKARLKADKHGLESTINEIRQLDFTIYTAETIEPLQNILKQAEELLTNEEASQAEVKQIVEQLKQAKANLVEISPENKQNLGTSTQDGHGVASGDTTQPLLYCGMMIVQVFLLYALYKYKKIS